MSSATPLLSFMRAYIVEMNVPAVGPDSPAPFEIRFNIDADDADVGPFAPEQASAPAGGDAYAPSVELSVGSLGLTITALSVERIDATRFRACRLEIANPVLRVAAADAGPLLDVFTTGLRISDVRLRYLRPDGSAAIAITAWLAESSRCTHR